jgi:hypothetical protein
MGLELTLRLPHRKGAHQAPRLRFEVMDAETLELGDERFDFIILSDLVNDLWDVQTTLAGLRPYCHPGTRLVLNFTAIFGRSAANGTKASSSNPDAISKLAYPCRYAQPADLEGFELLRDWPEMVVPLPCLEQTGSIGFWQRSFHFAGLR